jgi:hypothetical protein
MRLSKLEPFQKKSVPVYSGLYLAIGAGIVWASIGQGSGELIWWPYLTAKYNGFFLFLVLPACLMGYWVNLEIIRYTVLTGENIFASFLRLNRILGWILWIGMIATFLWFGGYASAGGTAIAELTKFPIGWELRSQSLFWAYAFILIYLVPIILGPVVYKWIELIMKTIAVVSIIAIILACLNRPVLANLNSFIYDLFRFKSGVPNNWDPKDLNILITAITLTGMGGYFSLMYSYWIRDKGVGMAKYCGRITSPITGKKETIPATGYYFEDNNENRKHMKGWIKAAWVDNAIAVSITTITLVLLCLLSLSILAPLGSIPTGWKITVVQAEFFRNLMGGLGRVLFLIIAAAFLSDTWLGVTDAVSRMNADFITLSFKKAQKKGFRWWYYATVAFLTLITCFTMLLEQPGTLILIGGIANFFAMVLYCPALIIMNWFVLPKRFPKWTKPSLISLLGMVSATLFYTVLAVWYIILQIKG